MINKDKPLKDEEPEDKRPKKSKLRTVWRATKGARDFTKTALIIIAVVAIIATVLIHATLFLLVGTIEYKDDLNYCKYAYGKGWSQGDDPILGSFCYFTEENGTKTAIFITREQKDSRLCERRFYNKFYCG